MATGSATMARLHSRFPMNAGTAARSARSESTMVAPTRPTTAAANHFSWRRSTPRERTNLTTREAAASRVNPTRPARPIAENSPYSGLGTPSMPIGLSTQVTQPSDPSSRHSWSLTT